MMPSDPLTVPDYSTPNKKKRLVEVQRQELQDAVIQVTGDGEMTFLQPPFGDRRQKAILSVLDRAETEFQGFGLRSVVESFVQNELNPFNNYNHIDSDMDLRIGAALWILEKLRASEKLHEAYKILPDTVGNLDVWYLPMNFYHPCFDNDLIQSVMYVVTTRYGEHSEALMAENTRGKPPSETWRQLLGLLPEEDVRAACEVFKTKVWELATRNMKGQAYYDKAIGEAFRRLKNATAFSGPQAGPLAQKPEAGLQQLGLPGGKDTFELARRGEELLEREHGYTVNFDRFLLMDKKQVRRETGSREVAEVLDGFTVADPYELCFALFYLLDNGDDAPWLMRSGCSLMEYARGMLPWVMDWDDDWDDGIPYNRNGWMERKTQTELLDFFHEKHGERNLAQVIYGLCRGVVPIGLHPFETEREQMIAEGMDEDKAHKVTDIAEMMFLHISQEKKYRPSEWGFEEGDEIEAAAEPEEKPGTQLKSGSCRDETTADQGMAAEALDTDDREENRRLRAELAQAKKQIKNLKTVLNDEKHTADADRAKYERELKALRMEHRELADLRSLVFNRENEVREEPAEGCIFPYETIKRTVIFGGHDTFLKAIKPMLPTVKFVDASNMAFNPEIIRNADVVWIQNNCISHSQYWSIVKNCKLAGVQMRYFGFASAAKCAEQLVMGDRKGIG